jgi:pimeloyl-ACP methyl ester carboxylesterase
VRNRASVVLLHGSMETGRNHVQLAEALADAFTLYLPDRRGRGDSGPYGDQVQHCAGGRDLDALLTEPGATNVFGVSAGGLSRWKRRASAHRRQGRALRA